MTPHKLSDVTIIDVAATPVALMEHRGDPARIGETVLRFIAWRKAAGLPPKASETFTIFWNPEPAEAEDCHIGLCAGTGGSAFAGGDGVVASVIPAGRCAALTVIGPSGKLSAAARFLYRDWLPVSGARPRDFPLYCQRIRFFPDVPEDEAVTVLFLPLA